MQTSMRQPARALTLVAALLLMVLSLGLSGSAFADPGNGKGSGGSGGAGAAAGGGISASSGAKGSSTTSTASTTSSSSTTSAKGSSSTSSKGSSSSSGKSKASSGKGKAGSHGTGGTAGTSGDVTSPQQPSNADQNGGGANGKCPGGPYCSTRDGSPSLNGNGKGKAVGKPCAGCVGKADNKSPKGQHPNGSDHNAGYECDRNHGIGRTNPAHTGCVSTPPPPCVDTPSEPCTPPPPCVETPSEPCTPPPPCVNTDAKPCTPPTCETDATLCPPECVEGVDAGCTETTPNRPPAVLGIEGFAHKPAEVLGTQAIRPAAVLPNTGAGAGLGLLGFAGLGLVMVGAVTMVLRRRPHQG